MAEFRSGRAWDNGEDSNEFSTDPETCDSSDAFMNSGSSTPINFRNTATSTSNKKHGVWLQIVREPEETHRARYMSEGSRGAVKDETGTSFCSVKLHGYTERAMLQVYAGVISEPCRPHPFYSLLPVTSKPTSQTTRSKEVKAHDGKDVLEIVLEPANDMTAALDSVGILKLCSEESRRRRGKSAADSTIRIVCRVFVPPAVVGAAPDSGPQEIFAYTRNIYCGQLMGLPEIRRISATSGPMIGGTEIFIIGRNFDRNTKVMFHEAGKDKQPIWIAEAEIEKSILSQCHLILKSPAYYNPHREERINVTVTVECGQKRSRSVYFTYIPDVEPSPDTMKLSQWQSTSDAPLSLESPRSINSASDSWQSSTVSDTATTPTSFSSYDGIPPTRPCTSSGITNIYAWNVPASDELEPIMSGYFSSSNRNSPMPTFSPKPMVTRKRKSTGNTASSSGETSRDLIELSLDDLNDVINSDQPPSAISPVKIQHLSGNAVTSDIFMDDPMSYNTNPPSIPEMLTTYSTQDPCFLTSYSTQSSCLNIKDIFSDQTSDVFL